MKNVQTTYTHQTPPPSQLVNWSRIDVACALLQNTENKGVGMAFQDVLTLFSPIPELTGTILQAYLTKDDEYDYIWSQEAMGPLLLRVRNWIKEAKQNDVPITLTMDCFNWFLITHENILQLDVNYFIDNILEKLEDIDFYESSYEKIAKEENMKAIQCLGDMAQKDAEWPYIIHGSEPKLDWRFSTHILKSVEESRNVSRAMSGSTDNIAVSLAGEMNGEWNQDDRDKRKEREQKRKIEKEGKSIHEYIAEEVQNSEEYKIYVLLALSGAGKSHSLFYLNTSSTAFTLPIDFGSTEDCSINFTEPLTFITEQVKRLKKNEETSQAKTNHNKNVVKEITAEIEGLFCLRALMLLKVLEIRNSKGISLDPAMWIKFLYSGGSECYRKFYGKWQVYLRTLCKESTLFATLLRKLKNVLESNNKISCKKIILTVDEINPLIKLGHGNNKITVLAQENTNGSVATVLFRILSDSVVPSVVSGTKIDTGVLQTIISSRLKEKIQMIPYYGPTNAKQLSLFASKYIIAPKISHYGSEFLFTACCTILEGRRRAFMKFLSNIVYFARTQLPCPDTKDQDSLNEWKKKLIIRAFLRYSPKKFESDITNFLEEDIESDYGRQLKLVKIDVSLYLLLRNILHSDDIQKILSKHFSSQKTTLLHHGEINLSIIYNGISFGKVGNRSLDFESTEVVHLIYLNEILRDNYDRALEIICEWLQEAFKNEKKLKRDQNEEIGDLFEIIGALILIDIGKSLSGKPLTSHPLFEDRKGTFLDNYTLNNKLSLLRNREYWKVLIMIQKYCNELGQHSQFFGNVVVFGLDQSIKVDVKTLLIPLDTDSKILELNMTSKFITDPKHTTDFRNNFLASDYRNAFMCNDLEEIQPNMEEQRELFKENVDFKTQSLRILFDYTSNETELFDTLVQNENPNHDEIVLFGQANKKFLEYFQSKFPNLYTVIENSLKKSQN